MIFIDEILAKCHKAGIKALSRHDSIVCRQCDKHKVTKIVCKVLNILFGRYTYALDIDGDLFDLKPKRKSRLGRVATTLFSQLKVGMNWGNGPPPEVECAPLCPADISPKGEKCANVLISELANEDHPLNPPRGGQSARRPQGDVLATLDVTKRMESILGKERVGRGDTAAALYRKLGFKLDSDNALREKHRRDLELFKLKLEERRKRSFRR